MTPTPHNVNKPGISYSQWAYSGGKLTNASGGNNYGCGMGNSASHSIYNSQRKWFFSNGIGAQRTPDPRFMQYNPVDSRAMNYAMNPDQGWGFAAMQQAQQQPMMMMPNMFMPQQQQGMGALGVLAALNAGVQVAGQIVGMTKSSGDGKGAGPASELAASISSALSSDSSQALDTAMQGITDKGTDIKTQLAKPEYASVDTDLQTAQGQKKDVDAKVKDQQGIVNDNTKTLGKYNETYIPAAQAKFNTAQTSLDNAKNMPDEVAGPDGTQIHNAAKDTAVANAQTALDAAKTDLEKKQSEAKDIQAKIDAAKEQLGDDSKGLLAEQKTIDGNIKALENLKNEKAELKKDLAEITKAQTDGKTKATKLVAQETKELGNLKGKYDKEKDPTKKAALAEQFNSIIDKSTQKEYAKLDASSTQDNTGLLAQNGSPPQDE